MFLLTEYCIILYYLNNWYTAAYIPMSDIREVHCDLFTYTLLEYSHHRQHKEAIVFHVGRIDALQVVVGA